MCNRVSVKQIERLDSQIKEMFNTDYKDSHLANKEMYIEDVKWTDIMESSITLQPEKYYEVKLPLREDTKLPCNRPQVFHSFLSLIRKLQANPELLKEYEIFMNMMKEKEFIEKVPLQDLHNEPTWYLTHHAVFHKQKQTIRVVFNCSLRYKGASLNDHLYQGPDLANSLLGVLLRFRQGPIAVMGDIEKMYYQVQVSPSCRDYLRFFWVDTIHSKPQEYRLKVHVFGATSSPSVANFALKRTTHDNPNYSMQARQTVQRSFYIDDLLISVGDETEAINLVTEVKDLVAEGGFNLTKFISNSAKVQTTLQSDSSSNVDSKQISAVKGDRALGLIWNTKKDTLGINLQLEIKPATKRGVLSGIHSVFDPMGMCGPILVPAKQIFQEACKLRLDWDTELPEPLKIKWNLWINDLPLLQKFEINRCYTPINAPQVELHFFSDGSVLAYGSVAYARVKLRNDQYHCSLLLSKTRLNPLSNDSFRTIPRVELNAAKLSIILRQILEAELDCSIVAEYYWTDSTTVLKYINNENQRFETFVTNRVRFIRSTSKPTQWRYVPSSLNPADLLSRGVQVKKFHVLEEWKNGPAFLSKPESHWPKQELTEQSNEGGSCELSRTHKNLSTNTPDLTDPCENLLYSTNSWFKLRCRIAWVLRYKATLHHDRVSTDKLSVTEIKMAEKAIIRWLQNKYFHSSINMLRSKNKLARNDPIRKLDLFY